MTLVIGYGNPLRSDDRLGQYLAQQLGRAWGVITRTQLMPELAEPISKSARVVFIDAGIGETTGEITCEKVEPLPGKGAFSHNVTPPSLLAAAQELYGTTPEGILISITGVSFDYGCTFSPQIHSQLPEIVSRVEAITTAFFETPIEAEL